MNDTVHIPVLLCEVADALQPIDGQVIVDGTFGGGGYSRALLRRARCTSMGSTAIRTRSSAVKNSLGNSRAG